MTRENKLALIIGFGLVLVVGILVSDHFSLAHTQDSARMASKSNETTPLANRLRNPALLVPTDEYVAPPPLIDDHANDQRAGTQMPPNGRESEVQAVPDSPTGSKNEELSVIDLPDLTELRRGQVDNAGTNSSPGQASSAGDRFTWHTVEAGETLSKIAAEVLGDPNRWRELAAINTDRIPDPNNVAKGVLIRIPVRGSSGDSSTRKRETTQQKTRETQVRKHVVAKNENLSEIAAKYLGSARRWREIYEANRDVISNPDNVRAGTELTIPTR